MDYVFNAPVKGDDRAALEADGLARARKYFETEDVECVQATVSEYEGHYEGQFTYREATTHPAVLGEQPHATA